ncbi:MAG: indole-3-glycerol phosphate synthase TrpC [Bacteroidota bacterium]
MKTILDQIVIKKAEELVLQKQSTSLKTLENMLQVSAPTSFSAALSAPGNSGIIAEFKRSSPSKGTLKDDANVENITQGYINSGAVALSVLTNEYFFGAHKTDFEIARKVNDCPTLRKEFIIDEYQVIESKLMGADVILLIAAVLTPRRTMELALIARQAGMEVLLEIHNEEELDHLNEYINVVGVNNRNLKDFTVSIQRSMDLYDRLPSNILKISESGIDSPDKLIKLKQKGFSGFLIGEKFMVTPDPAISCLEFINQIQIKTNTHIVYGF